MLKQLSLNNCSSPTCYILNQECIFDQAIIIKQETDWSPNYSERRKFTRSFRSKGERERESGSHLHRRHGEGPRYGPDAACGWRQLGGELPASAADSIGLDYICDPGLTCTGGMEGVLGMEQMRYADGAGLVGSCRHRLRTVSAWTRSATSWGGAPSLGEGRGWWELAGDERCDQRRQAGDGRHGQCRLAGDRATGGVRLWQQCRLPSCGWVVPWGHSGQIIQTLKFVRSQRGHILT